MKLDELKIRKQFFQNDRAPTHSTNAVIQYFNTSPMSCIGGGGLHNGRNRI